MSDNGNRIELSGIFSEGYGIIPKKLMRSKEIGLYEKAVLAYMLSYTGGGSECFPSYERIADEMGISKSTVAKVIKKVSDAGFVRKEKLYPNDPLKHNNKYILSFLDSSPDGQTIVPHRVLPTVRQVDSRGPSDGLPLTAKTTSNNNSINNNILTQVLEKWNAYDCLIKHSIDTANRKMHKKQYDEISDYGMPSTLIAIDNYAHVLSSDKYYWSHRYSLWDFIARALDKFVPDAKPRENFLKKNNTSSDGIPTTNDAIRKAYGR